MRVCSECCAVEQGVKEITEDGETFEVCAVCEFPAEEVMQSFDEDYGSDR